MGPLIGVDYGDKRIGIAVSDPLGIIASPHSLLERVSDEQAAKAILKLAGEIGVALIVVGFPRNMDGSEGFRADKTRKFIAALEDRAEGVQIVVHDERLTTVQAERSLRTMEASRSDKKKKVDVMAASLILQSYLDRERFKERMAQEDGV